MMTIRDIAAGLQAHGYLCDDQVATTVFLALRLGKPILIEGPAGVGKTELAKALSRWRGARLIRLQCYEGLDEARALYEWDYKKQLLHIQAVRGAGSGEAPDWETLEENLFSESFLVPRPLLEAIRATDPCVLLIDEVDKVDPEFEALLLEILSDFQVSIPELGTIAARQIPLVVITSNSTRELSEALKRRCLFLYMDYPDAQRELAIIRLRLPGIDERLAEQVVRFVAHLRRMDLRMAPSVAETVDWARALMALGASALDEATIRATLNVLLKYRTDVERVLRSIPLATEAEA